MAKTRSSRKQSTKKNRLYKGGVPPKTKHSVSRTQSPGNKIKPYRPIAQSHIPLGSGYNERVQGPIAMPRISASPTTGRGVHERVQEPIIYDSDNKTVHRSLAQSTSQTATRRQSARIAQRNLLRDSHRSSSGKPRTSAPPTSARGVHDSDNRIPYTHIFQNDISHVYNEKRTS